RPDPSPLPGPSGSKTRIVLPWTTFQENIRVYVDPKGVARADHDLDLGRAISAPSLQDARPRETAGEYVMNQSYSVEERRLIELWERHMRYDFLDRDPQ